MNTYWCHLQVFALALPAISDSIVLHFPCVSFHCSVSFSPMAEIIHHKKCHSQAKYVFVEHHAAGGIIWSHRVIILLSESAWIKKNMDSEDSTLHRQLLARLKFVDIRAVKESDMEDLQPKTISTPPPTTTTWLEGTFGYFYILE